MYLASVSLCFLWCLLITHAHNNPPTQIQTAMGKEAGYLPPVQSIKAQVMNGTLLSSGAFKYHLPHPSRPFQCLHFFFVWFLEVILSPSDPCQCLHISMSRYYNICVLHISLPLSGTRTRSHTRTDTRLYVPSRLPSITFPFARPLFRRWCMFLSVHCHTHVCGSIYSLSRPPSPPSLPPSLPHVHLCTSLTRLCPMLLCCHMQTQKEAGPLLPHTTPTNSTRARVE